MARYPIGDDKIFNTELAEASWEENTYFDGSNHIGCESGSQWSRSTLYLSSKGNYFLVTTSAYQNVRDKADQIDELAAARWIMRNACGDAMPEKLKGLVADMVE